VLPPEIFTSARKWPRLANPHPHGRCIGACLPPALSEKKLGELWTTKEKFIGAHVDPPKINTARAV